VTADFKLRNERRDTLELYPLSVLDVVFRDASDEGLETKPLSDLLKFPSVLLSSSSMILSGVGFMLGSSITCKSSEIEKICPLRFSDKRLIIGWPVSAVIFRTLAQAPDVLRCCFCTGAVESTSFEANDTIVERVGSRLK
jgi:hypothetical protein